MSLAGIFCGLFQILFGVIKIGKSLLTSSAKAKLLFAPLISEHGLYRHFNDKCYRADFLGITGNSDYTFSPTIVFNNHIYTGQYSRIVTGICGNNNVFLPLKDSVCYFMELTDTTYALANYQAMDYLDSTWTFATYFANCLGKHFLSLPGGGTMAGVKIYTLTPKTIADQNKDRILLNLHGGGYVLNPGVAGTLESVYMAGFGGMKVVCADYRMPPDYPYPASMDDAMAVYRELLKTYPPEKIGVFGTSTGGGMTLALVLRCKKEGLPLPGAIAPGTPWSDLTRTGDSYFTNDHVDNILVSYDGWLKSAAKVYANGHDLKDPMLSPIYGDMSGFPPALLTSGTRDLFLSNTVRAHLKLLEAGCDASLIVFEGMSHAEYHMVPDAPETAFHFRQVAKFFEKHLK